MGLKLLLIHFFLFWHPELMIFCNFKTILFVFLFFSIKAPNVDVDVHAWETKQEANLSKWIYKHVELLNDFIKKKPEMIVAISLLVWSDYLIGKWSVKILYFDGIVCSVMDVFIRSLNFGNFWLFLIKQHCIIMIN